MTVIWKYSGFMRTCLNQTNSTTKVNNMQVFKILILFKRFESGTHGNSVFQEP